MATATAQSDSSDTRHALPVRDWPVRQVLDQRATEADIGDLHPTADRQEREPAVDECTHEGDVVGVLYGVEVGGTDVSGPAVGGRIQISAAGYDRPVRLAQAPDDAVAGWQHIWIPAGTEDRLHDPVGGADT